MEIQGIATDLEGICDQIDVLEGIIEEIETELNNLHDRKLDLGEAKYNIKKELDELYEIRNELWAEEREEEELQYRKAVI